MTLFNAGAQRVYLATCRNGKHRYVPDFAIFYSIEKVRYSSATKSFECSYNGDRRGYYRINSSDMCFADAQYGFKFRARLLMHPGIASNAPFGSRTSRTTTDESPLVSDVDGQHCVGRSLLALGYRNEELLLKPSVTLVEAANICNVGGRVQLIKVNPATLQTTLMESGKAFIAVIEGWDGTTSHTIAVNGSEDLFIDSDPRWGSAPRTKDGLQQLEISRFVMARELVDWVQRPKIYDALLTAGYCIRALERQPEVNMKAACAIVEASVRPTPTLLWTITRAGFSYACHPTRAA